MMTILYERSGGQQSPPDQEQLEIGEDGSFTLWRSVGWATQPPTPIGSFEGWLEPDELRDLEQEAYAAAPTGDLKLPPPPDEAVETVMLGWVEARLGLHDHPEGAWGPLMTRLRRLLGTLAAFPRAAIGLEVGADGTSARLVHQGADPLTLDLSELSLRAVVWRDTEGQAEQRGQWESGRIGTPDASRVKAKAGWSLKLVLPHGLTLEPGDELSVYASFAVLDDEWAIPASLLATVAG